MILSIDESIQRFKSEIIAPDWRLNQKRADLLDAAISCMKQRFKSRKAALAILVMAANVLEYVKKRGDKLPPDSIDFLKEAMAHIVTLYEDPVFDPEKDEKLFQTVYSRFESLKKKIKAQGREQKEITNREKGEKEAAKKEVAREITLTATLAAPGRVEESSPATVVPDEEDEKDASVQDEQEQGVDSLDENEQPTVVSFLQKPNDHAIEGVAIDKLVSELEASLHKTEEVGAAIRDLLDELTTEQKKRAEKTEGPGPGPEQRAEVIGSDTGRAEDRPPEEVLTDPVREQKETKACPATEIRCITLGEKIVAMPESVISIHRAVTSKQRKTYLDKNNVPLGDFSRFMRDLSKQFKGALSAVKSKKLKKIILPVMVPRGMELPDMPDDNANELLVVCHGQWCGVVLCSEVYAETKTMEKFRKDRNGDIAGIAFTADGEEVPLLNVVPVLRREGFLVMT